MDKKVYERVKREWGKAPNRKYSSEEFEKISYYFSTKYKDKPNAENIVDDITWNDLDMNSLYALINNTPSSVGDAYLYSNLRKTRKDENVLKERGRLAEYFKANEKEAFLLSEALCHIGKNKKNKTSLYEYISKIFSIKKQSNAVHYIMIALFGLSIASLFFISGFSILFLIAMIFINVISYYKFKAKIEVYFNCFKYTVLIIKGAKRAAALKINEISDYNNTINDIAKKMSRVTKGSFLIASGNVSGSLVDVLMDYVRMLLHVDLIKFNSAQKYVSENADLIIELYKTVGELELGLANASFRKYLESYTTPVFTKENKVDCDNIYHPIIKNPVKNSLHNATNILLTGSNASGKSTFLKTVAINAILAQSLYIATADSFTIPFCDVFSSMALRDDILSSESYFIVEIKSIKRILNSKKDYTVLCFIDEVLRGTNTIERIAASSEILKSLSKDGFISFAATHDIELTGILKDDYSNYHFEEEILDNDVKFNYVLNEGIATSRNAIKLLNYIGYDKEIVDNAINRAKNFENTGVWN